MINSIATRTVHLPAATKNGDITQNACSCPGNKNKNNTPNIDTHTCTYTRTFNIPPSHVISILLASFLNIFISLHFHISLATWPPFSGHCHMNTKLPILYTTVTCVYKTCLSLCPQEQSHMVILI